MLQLIKIHKEKIKDKSEATKTALKNMPKIAELPELPIRNTKSDDDISEDTGSTLVCTPRDILPRVMIRGTRVVPFDPQLKSKASVFLEPLFFKRQIECNTPAKVSSKILLSETLPQEISKNHAVRF